MINTHPDEVTSHHKRRPLTGHWRCGNGLSSSVEMVMEKRNLVRLRLKLVNLRFCVIKYHTSNTKNILLMEK